MKTTSNSEKEHLSKRNFVCLNCLVSDQVWIIIRDSIEYYICKNCENIVLKHWIECLDVLALSKPILFIGRKNQAEDLLPKKDEAAAAAAKDGCEIEEEKDNYLSPRISRITDTNLYAVYYDIPLNPIYIQERIDKLITNLDSGLFQLDMDKNKLENREDFFNYEATRIVDLEEKELIDRIEKYGDILFSARVFQNAVMVRLKEVVAASRKELNLESLKPEKKAASKARASSTKNPTEAAARSLMKIMPSQLRTMEEAIAYIEKQKGG